MVAGILIVIGLGAGAYFVHRVREFARERQPRPLSKAALSAPRMAEIFSKADAWSRRTVAGAYETAGVRSPAWDEPARRFLQQAAPWAVKLEFGPENAFEAAAIADEGRRVVGLGCTDPLVLAITGQAALVVDPESAEGLALLRRGFEDFKITTYPRAAFRLAASWLAEAYTRSDDQARDATRHKESEWLTDSFSDGSYREGDDDVLALTLLYPGDVAAFERAPEAVANAMAGTTWSAPWLRRLVSGRRYHYHAVSVRGAKFANEVDEATWKRVHDLMAHAREDYAAVMQLDPSRPEPAALMVAVVAIAGIPGDLPPRIWFDRAVALRFDHRLAYSTYLFTLLDQWGGSDAEMMAFGAECLTTAAFDTHVPRVVWRATTTIDGDRRHEHHEGPQQSIYREPKVYDLVARMLQGYVASPAVSAADKKWYEATWALAAHYSGRYDEASEHLRRADGIIPHQLMHEHEDPRVLALRIAALGSRAARAAVVKGEDALARGDMAAAYANLVPLREDGAAGPYVAQLLVAPDLNRALAEGKPTRLVPAPTGLASWLLHGGSWAVEPQGAVSGLSGPRGLVAWSPATVGRSFEALVDAELGDTVSGFHGLGVAVGTWDHAESPQSAGAPGPWFSVRLRRERGGLVDIGAGRGFNTIAGTYETPGTYGTRLRLVVQVWDGRWTAWLDDRPVAIGVPLPGDVSLDEKSRFGLASMWEEGGAYGVRFHDVRVRRLVAPPERGVPFANAR